jgi:uncharacterized damage-inducible protein DinB
MDITPDQRGKSSLIGAIQRHRAELEATIAPLNHVQLEASPAGGWSIKDHLAHIAAWEMSAVALLTGTPRYAGLGVDRATYESHDVDAVNQGIFRQNHHRPMDDVLADFRDAHQQLMAVLNSLSDEDLQKTYSDYLPDEPAEETGAPVLGWIAGNTYHHYAEHLEIIRELANG